LGVVFVLASAAALSIPLLRGADAVQSPTVRVTFGASSAESPAPQHLAVVCRKTSDDYCARWSADLIRRAPLTDAERATAMTVATRVRQAIPAHPTGACVTDPPTPTGSAVPRPVPTRCGVSVARPDAESIRRALTAVGFTDAVVRPARTDDPAPAGSVLVAVGAGPACVVLFEHPQGGQDAVVGRLPDGTCRAA
jgi:hypothetical protein